MNPLLWNPNVYENPYATDLNNLDIALGGLPYDGAVEARSGARQDPRQTRDMSSVMRAIHHVTRINPYTFCWIADVGDVHFNQIFDVVASHAMAVAEKYMGGLDYKAMHSQLR